MQGGLRDKITNMHNPPKPLCDASILLIQEAGNSDGKGLSVDEKVNIFGRNFWCIISEKDPGAKSNYRCTTSILADQHGRCRISGGGVCGERGIRPVVFVNTDFGRIATVHNTADGTIGSLMNVIRKEFDPCDSWIIMGDMNKSPKELTGMDSFPQQLNFYNLGSSSRPYGFFFIYHESPTQGAKCNRNRILDYCFVSHYMSERIINGNRAPMMNEMISGPNGRLSDHNMIGIGVHF